jgi:hypothetical protein
MRSIVCTELDSIRTYTQIVNALEELDIDDSTTLVIRVYRDSEDAPFLTLRLVKAPNSPDNWVLLSKNRRVLAGFSRVNSTVDEIAEEILSHIPAYASRIEVKVSGR